MSLIAVINAYNLFDDAFLTDGSQVGHVPDRLRLHIRGPLLPGLVRPVAVVMVHVLAEHPGQVAFAEDQDPVEQLAAEGPVDALADGVHLWRLGKVVMIRSPPALNTSPDAAVKTGSRS